MSEIDILSGREREVNIGEHGKVYLVDVMPRLVTPGDTLDHAVIDAARISYGMQTEPRNETKDRALIRYLFRNMHVTPFEMVNVKWHHILPIFVARQLIRHRTASVNEFSMRYKKPPERFFIPERDGVRKQSKVNKQGSDVPVDEAIADKFIAHCRDTAAREFTLYGEDNGAGIGKEIARINLPLSTFTEWFWEIDLNNLLKFLSLRQDAHAQKEIRDYADAMYNLLKPLAPWTFEAYEDFDTHRGAIRLSKLDIQVVNTMNRADFVSAAVQELITPWGWLKRKEDGTLEPNGERTECEAKLKALGHQIPW